MTFDSPGIVLWTSDSECFLSAEGPLLGRRRDWSGP